MDINEENLYNNDGVSYEDLELEDLFKKYINLNVFVNGMDDYISQDPESFTNLTTIREIELLKEFGYWN